MNFKLIRLAGLVGLTLATNVLGQANLNPTEDKVVEQLGNAFTAGLVKVNGTSLHFVRGGTGPPVILIHGFPEDWYEFRKVMPQLVSRFTVVAVDLRGVGESAATSDGYDAANLAKDIHELAENLHLEHVYVVGHDIGGMVAYAFARRYPQGARGVMILDVALPGLDPWNEIEALPVMWHVLFHQTDLPEKLVAGRQQSYFSYFFSAKPFSDETVVHYANAYRDPDHLKTAFEFYRAFLENAKFNAEQRAPIPMPFVLGAGEWDVFARFLPRIAEVMRTHGCANVRTAIIKGSVHYVVEEKPEAVADLILQYASE
ncbi:alpha/beta fold hydrolase [Tunturibacter empetritectus]|uniref:Pimeloyl-ACP methyl ester carboxylesterase n=1 Tax=Tunturiibacter empetritectus TaxID=3069691 RepID=A0A7W8IJ03_9BACT|nr:alpha/beta hydrolase [Edaphobacter lichenicola]MBB5317947.1 pimeloyl-ACP methyl ester carboxylesterase [Edaphobacter lichenicola]